MAEVILKKVEKQYPNGFKAVHGIDLHKLESLWFLFNFSCGCASQLLFNGS